MWLFSSGFCTGKLGISKLVRLTSVWSDLLNGCVNKGELKNHEPK